MSTRTDRIEALDLSIVIPVLNEAGNVKTLCDEIHAALDSRLRYEIIFVDDGSTDDTPALVKECMAKGNVRLLRHSRTSGQSAAVRTGVGAARARLVGTLDGDCQNDPADLIRLYEVATSSADGGTTSLVMGHRERRRDSLLKRISSRVANGVRSRLLGDDCPDSGCGIKVFDRKSYLDLPFFDHMHRFLPALFGATGQRVVSVPVGHRPRLHGTSKYGLWNRLWVGIVDMAGVMWLRRRAKAGLTITEEENPN